MDSPETIRGRSSMVTCTTHTPFAPPPADLSAFGGGDSEFDTGKAAMRIFGRSPQAGMLQNPNIDLGVVGTPSDAADANILFWSGFGVLFRHPKPG